MSRPEIAYPCSLCNDLLKHKPWLRLIGGWILPQHLNFYNGVFDEIKLAGRVSLAKSDRYFDVLESYIEKRSVTPDTIGGGPASVNLPMTIDEDFFSYTLRCAKNCHTCSVCEGYWQKKLRIYG
jgi:hypothetical protein